MQPTNPSRRRGDIQLVRDLPLGAVPEEGPSEHLRTALALLVAHETAHPGIWKLSPELPACEARLLRALFQIEGSPISVPPGVAE
jgi:hypothetical protein